jgi:phosphatidylserine/phosphatidylglycerophosphate/cardiolipin synthase-like enzyme
MSAAVMVLLCAGQVLAPRVSPQPAVVDRDIAVYFSPDGGCLDAVVSQIGSARKSIDVQAFLLTTEKIAEPLVAAHQRGVAVRIIFDADQAADDFSLDERIVRAGVPVWLDAPEEGKGKAHNKIMIIDGQTVITGSYNFTLTADEKNAENLLVIRGRPLIANAYRRNFEARLAAARRHPDQKP